MKDTVKDRRTQLETFFPYRFAVAAEAFSRALVEVYGGAFGLSREEWRLLFLLAGGEGMTSLDLARRTTLDKVQVSRASRRLADKGLITRGIDRSDRRLRVYACTETGRKRFHEILPQVQARADRILDAMDPAGRTALETGLTALMEAMPAKRRPTPGGGA